MERVRRSGRLQGNLEDLARWWLDADLSGGSPAFSGARLKLTHVFFGLPERDHKSLLLLAVNQAVTAFETGELAQCRELLTPGFGDLCQPADEESESSRTQKEIIPSTSTRVSQRVGISDSGPTTSRVARQSRSFRRPRQHGRGLPRRGRGNPPRRPLATSGCDRCPVDERPRTQSGAKICTNARRSWSSRMTPHHRAGARMGSTYGGTSLSGAAWRAMPSVKITSRQRGVRTSLRTVGARCHWPSPVRTVVYDHLGGAACSLFSAERG